MEVSAKFWSAFLALALQVAVLKADLISIRVENRRDYEVMDQFFRMGISEEEYGFVLEGAKPISIRDFYALDHFPISKDLEHAEKEFAKTLLVHEAFPIWKRICPNQTNFALKVVPLNMPESVAPGCEVQFINIAKLTTTIEKNIDLFRYALGPNIDPEQLVKKIAYSDERLGDILHNDRVLEGIVLGFGSHNSVVGGRVEKIQALSISKDHAPFSPKSVLMQGERNHTLHFLSPEMFGSYYLEFAGGDDTVFRDESASLNPSPGFINVEEELRTLDEMQEPLPISLTEKPAFVFGAFKKGPPNQPFFKHLKQVQTHTRSLLKMQDILDTVLEKIGGKKPIITCSKHAVSPLSLSFFNMKLKTHEWIRILRGIVDRLGDIESQAAFIEAFSQPSSSSRAAPTMINASKATLVGLKKALFNLSMVNSQFELLSKDSNLFEVVPKQLYYKTTLLGAGKTLRGRNRVRMGYVIEDPEGNVLYANHDTWLNLSQTIPGLSHGVQGMRLGERRTLFIHPVLAYGALTTLPPCMGLVVKTHLLDVDDQSSSFLPSLIPLDVGWLENPSFHRAIRESLRQRPRFVGSFYRDLIDKMGGFDTAGIIAELRAHESSY